MKMLSQYRFRLGVKTGVFILFLIPGISNAQSEPLLDSSFITQCDKWKVRVQRGLFGSPKISFGDFKIIEVDKSKTKLIKETTENGIIGGMIFGDVTRTEKDMTTNLVILHNENDTAFIQTIFNTVDEYEIGGILAKDPEYPTRRISTRFKEMRIQIAKNRSYCRFVPTAVKSDSLEGISDNYGKLICSIDTFKMETIRDYGRDVYKWSRNVTGIVFFQKGQQIAACQFVFPKFIWLSKDLNNEKRLAIGSTIAALLFNIEKYGMLKIL